MRYITAKEAQALRDQGRGDEVQPGNWVETKTYESKGLSKLIYRSDKSDKVGVCLHPTNPDKTVGERNHKLFVARKTHKIILEEPASAHLVKGLMSSRRKQRKIDELSHLIVKVKASVAILEDSMEQI